MELAATFEKFFKQAQNEQLETASYPKRYDDLIMDVGFGFGMPAQIPWIAFLAPGQTVMKGIFPVFYFFKKLHYVILAYGISEESIPTNSWGAPLNVQTIEQFFKTKQKLPAKYHSSYVFKRYSTLRDLDYNQMETDLQTLIKHYKTRFFLPLLVFLQACR